MPKSISKISEKVVICDNKLSETLTNFHKNQCSLEIFLSDLLLKFPEFIRGSDLIRMGLYKSRSDLCWSIKRGKAPPHIKVSSHKIIFARSSLCEWIKEKFELDCVVGEFHE